MAKLAARNFEMKINKKIENFKFNKGLDKSMTAKERMIRLRIRKKVKTAMWDLNVAELAGIIKSNKLMADAFEILLMHLCLSKDKNEMAFRAYSGLDYLKDSEYDKYVSQIKNMVDKGIQKRLMGR